MEHRQLLSLATLVETGYNVTEAAHRLNLVQSAVSQHLTRLENELGTKLFVRRGKRLVALTADGESVLGHARKLLSEYQNILAVGQDHVAEAEGVLRLGTTHTQARYVLPPIIRQFRERYPQIALQIIQDSPAHLVKMLLSDHIDLSVCTEEVEQHSELEAISCYRWNRVLIAPHHHPILERKPLSLETICQYPLITYSYGFTGSARLRSTFARAGLKPNVIISALDSDVIKTYVRENMGLGLLAEMAVSRHGDEDLSVHPLSHLLPWERTYLAYHKDKYLRKFQQYFIEILSHRFE